MMKIIDDPKIFRPLVEKAIELFGFAPEHNLEWWLAYADHLQTPVFASWSDGSGLLVYREEKAWYTFSEPLALEGRRGQKVAELADFVLKTYPNVIKVVTEARDDTRTQVIDNLSPDLSIDNDDMEDSYVLTWPLMNMEKFDPALPGGHFKYLRNAVSKFNREHKIEVKDAIDASKDHLHGLIRRWATVLKQKEVEGIHDEPYDHLIDADFAGTKTMRALVIDDKLIGLNGGWEIPNSNSFYASIGIHDYSIPDLGLILYLEDLKWIKQAGYPTADMGGVEEGNPLTFKKQFMPEHSYQTTVFSIVRK